LCFSEVGLDRKVRYPRDIIHGLLMASSSGQVTRFLPFKASGANEWQHLEGFGLDVRDYNSKTFMYHLSLMYAAYVVCTKIPQRPCAQFTSGRVTGIIVQTVREESLVTDYLSC